MRRFTKSGKMKVLSTNKDSCRGREPQVEDDSCESLLGYRITLKDIDNCVSELYSWITSGGEARYFVCANPHSLEVARKDTAFRAAISAADMVIPDGIGMVLASKLLGGRLRRRVTGTDLFLGLSRLLNAAGGCRYFFLGSTGTTLSKVREEMAARFPHIEVAGTFAPPFCSEFSKEDEARMVERVNRAAPDVLWVALTAPKQEKWAHANKRDLHVRMIGPIGAAFDFFTGTVARSHPWFCDHGMEWLPRLMQQPQRLWRRNFVSNPGFMLRVLRERRGRRVDG